MFLFLLNDFKHQERCDFLCLFFINSYPILCVCFAFYCSIPDEVSKLEYIKKLYKTKKTNTNE